MCSRPVFLNSEVDMFKNKLLAGIGALSMIGGIPAGGSELEQRLEKIDSLMNQAQETLRIPGMAVAAVVDGKVVFLKGYGVRNASESLPVTENTLFAIGSCSKAFTTFALGQLVDEGVLQWDDPVIRYLPEFRLKDLHATHHLTIRDLVTHRSGLPRHDMAWYNSDFSRHEILSRLQHLDPTCDLREKFQYNNLMYAVAGLVIEKVSGKTWEEFVDARIFTPLGLDRSNTSVDESAQTDDFASPHTEKEGQVKEIPFRRLTNIGPAGSINSSIKEMAKWVEIQLAGGEPLIRKHTLAEMHRIHMPVHEPLFEGLLGYGLGWFIGLHDGRFLVTHGGGIDGFVSDAAFYPKERIGVVVLTNSDSFALFPYMASRAIADVPLGQEPGDWLSKLEEKANQIKELRKSSGSREEAGSENPFIRPLEQYAGQFEHPGYGVIEVGLNDGRLAASYNGIRYWIGHAGNDHLTLSMESREAERKIGGFFMSNRSGEVSELHISLEAQLPPIAFKRKVSNDLLAAEYLRQFAGVYECPFFSLEIALKGGLLTADIPGAPSCALKPEKRNWFSIREVPDCKMEFVLNADGKVAELRFLQAGQNTTFTVKR